mmetsp:Transcript_12866/g.19541  ORF Transcript_12866/g.19541 Transcript_12866/m.19541 type:complete len:495 (+) Transcript_12866:174-1658(+)
MDPDPIKSMGMNDGDVSGEGEASNHKRRAQFGQWHTPPHPFFPAPTGTSNPDTSAKAGGISSDTLSAVAPVSNSLADITVPPEIFKGANPADYPALEEAYRRGAAAAVAFSQAAAMQQGVGNKMSSALSCPNLTDMLPPIGVPFGMPNPEQLLGMAMPPVPGNTTAKASARSKPATVVSTTTTAVDTAQNGNIPNTSSAGAAISASKTKIPAQPQHPGQQAWFNAQVARSVSLPDMTRYNNAENRAQFEDEKRKKRLARNRASARLRRLRKKNLVESYEHEVGVLETSLSKLKAHTWGSGDCEALLEALSMERGQQNLGVEERKELIVSILSQQREQIANLMEAHLETMMLTWGAKVSQGEIDVDENSEEAKLAAELEEVLKLTPEQKRFLSDLDTGEEERKAISAVDVCLEAMMNNTWLMNHGVEECTEQFASILNPAQMSKFMIWTDQNSDSIDCLDYVHAPPAAAPPAQSPVFLFGTDQAEDENQDQRQQD